MGSEAEAGRREKDERARLEASELCGRRNGRNHQYGDGAAAHDKAGQRRSLEEQQAE
jgi:hypothetical protein